MSAIIEVENVTKEFRLGQLSGLGDGLRNAWRGLRGQPVVERPPFKALDDVSFSVQPGEVLGIIGHNGAGKSTLLKLLANISRPTRGSVRVDGRIAPLIEVGAGFVPDFTGRENVLLNASILGMPKAEIRRRFDEIVEFAEMAEFIDTPVKRYSSGMQVKLAFAVATSVEADILIVDEVLAVGDLAFQRKCFDRMESLIKRQGRTVLLVTHNIRQVERLCTSALLLDHGRVAHAGGVKQTTAHYFNATDVRIHADAPGQMQPERVRIDKQFVDDVAVDFVDATGQTTDTVGYRAGVGVRISLRALRSLRDVKIAFGTHTLDQLYLSAAVTDADLVIDELAAGEHRFVATIPSFPFVPGNYAFRCAITAGVPPVECFYGECLAMLTVSNDAFDRARFGGECFVVHDCAWTHESESVARRPRPAHRLEELENPVR